MDNVLESTVPSLSTDGWLKSPDEQLKKIFDYFLASNQSQSNYYDVKSLKYILNQEDDVIKQASLLKEELEILYKSHFDNVAVDIVYDTIDGIVNFGIDVIVYTKDGQHKLSRNIATNEYLQ